MFTKEQLLERIKKTEEEGKSPDISAERRDILRKWYAMWRRKLAELEKMSGVFPHV